MLALTDQAVGMKGRLTSWADVKHYALAGNAYFTIVSLKTGTRFTFRVSQPKGRTTDFRFVSLLSGPDNTNDYQYMGIISLDGHFRRTAKSRITAAAASCTAFKWLADHLNSSEAMNPMLEVWHEGRCGRCGRHLTVPASVERGIGPECAGRMGVL